MRAGAESNHRSSRFQVTYDWSQLLIIELEKAGEEHGNIRVVQGPKTGQATLAFFRVPVGIEDGCLQAKALEFSGERRHGLLR